MSTVTRLFLFGALASGSLFADGTPEPFGLQAVGPVIQENAPVDASHQAYQDYRSTFLDYLDNPMNQTSMGSATFYNPLSGLFMGGTLIEDNVIDIPYQANLRMYFIRETAGFSNSLGFVNGNTDLLDPENLNSLIFPLIEANGDGLADQDLIGGPGFFLNPSSPDTTGLSMPEDAVLREEGNPVDDFVDLGVFGPNDTLDFFLVPDGADVASDATVATDSPWWDPSDPLDRDAVVWWTDDSLNIDVNDNQELPTRHVRVSRFANQGFVYYLLGWEDVPFPQNFASGVDFNDAVMVLQVTQVPEPGVYLILGTFLGVIIWMRGRKRAKSEQ